MWWLEFRLSLRTILLGNLWYSLSLCFVGGNCSFDKLKAVDHAINDDDFSGNQWSYLHTMDWKLDVSSQPISRTGNLSAFLFRFQWSGSLDFGLSHPSSQRSMWVLCCRAANLLADGSAKDTAYSAQLFLLSRGLRMLGMLFCGYAVGLYRKVFSTSVLPALGLFIASLILGEALRGVVMRSSFFFATAGREVSLWHWLYY